MKQQHWHIIIKPPTKRGLFVIRFLILIGLISLIQFLYWYLSIKHIGNFWLYALLTLTLGFKMMHILFEWFYLASMQGPPNAKQTRDWSVDMLTTFVPGEPYEMIEETLKAMVAVKYPHRTFLCDEGNDPYLKDFCKQHGIIHVYRGKDKSGAKAGNINFALENYAQGEISIILDPDHVPVPDFIDRVLPYFEDPKVGYVQSVQAYSNRNESFIAKAAAEQTYLFYGPLMMGMNRHNTVQAIGANCAFRREALDSIGGHAKGLCEDMHTSMQLFAKKWKSVYIPESLTRGLVPATLPAFYKQQLKWTRGAFELLFEIYPKLFKKFSWQQKIHYFLIPLFFLYGFISFIDILVPVISLIFLQIPLQIEFETFMWRATPLIICIMLIRLYAQHFLLEEHEEGFHFMSGTLRLGTWWIMLLGFIYAIFRIKVPYIPTPKGDELTNSWKLSIPNIAAIILSLFAISYGLYMDWNPYTWMMAGFAFINVTLLTSVVMMGQQKLIAKFYYQLYEGKLKPFRLWWYDLRHKKVYKTARRGVTAMIIVIISMTVSASLFIEDWSITRLTDLAPPPVKNNGIWLNGLNQENPENEWWNQLNEKAVPTKSILTYTFQWPGKDPLMNLNNLLSSQANENNILHIRWKPDTDALIDSSLAVLNLYDALICGLAKPYLSQIAPVLRNHQKPVLFSLIPDSDAYKIQVDSSDKINAWYHLVDQMERLGVGNLSWVWEYQEAKNIGFPYPGQYFADIMLLPYKKDLNLSNIEHLYLSEGHLPALVSLENVIPKAEGEAFIKEIKDSEIDILGITSTETTSRFPIGYNSLSNIPPPKQYNTRKTLALKTSNTDQKSRQNSIIYNIDSTNFKWYYEGQPFYVKGIAYNPEHDWRDGKWPLTIAQLREDFRKIKNMGANTIRRYGFSVYDRNILKVAEEEGLKVLYGFWFDPEIDYLVESGELEDYQKEVIEFVNTYKYHSAILGWVIGNETWGGLKHHFSQPYLTEVRLAYVGFIEQLAQNIRVEDPEHPVSTALEFSRDLRAALEDFHHFAPSVDIITVNAYYQKHLESLSNIMERWNPSRPYMVGEFGPNGYWDENGTPRDRSGRIMEQSSFEKARMYAQHWSAYIEGEAGKNVGGVAYCWRDRMEGTATWFGISDYSGRLKPSYYALKQVWTNQKIDFPISDLWLVDITNWLDQKSLLSFKAVSPNNNDLGLTFEWYALREEYLDKIDQCIVHYSGLGKLIYPTQREIKQHLSNGIFPQNKGRSVFFHNPSKSEFQRLYLHIYDDKDNVVTASLPIYPEQE